MIQVHGTSLAVDGIGVLLRGPSGSGKSDLALRLINAGAKLVADDQTALENEAGRIIMTSNAVLIGLLEVRGVGILPVPSIPRARLGLVCDLMAPADKIARLPEKEYAEYLGVRIQRMRLHAFAASAAAKLRIAAANLDVAPAPTRRR